MDVFGPCLANELVEIDSGCKRLHLRMTKNGKSPVKKPCGQVGPSVKTKKEILAYFKPNVSKGLATLVKQ